jgi:hypothetical protein
MGRDSLRPYTKGTVQVQLTDGEPFLEEQKVFSAIEEFKMVLRLEYPIG